MNCANLLSKCQVPKDVVRGEGVPAVLALADVVPATRPPLVRRRGDLMNGPSAVQADRRIVLLPFPLHHRAMMENSSGIERLGTE